MKHKIDHKYFGKSVGAKIISLPDKVKEYNARCEQRKKEIADALMTVLFHRAPANYGLHMANKFVCSDCGILLSLCDKKSPDYIRSIHMVGRPGTTPHVMFCPVCGRKYSSPYYGSTAGYSRFISMQKDARALLLANAKGKDESAVLSELEKKRLFKEAVNTSDITYAASSSSSVEEILAAIDAMRNKVLAIKDADINVASIVAEEYANTTHEEVMELAYYD